MSQNKQYASKKVFKKAIFNIGFQIVPIVLALILTPYLIETMRKDFWAKYSIGISLIFLSNYFSFGIGPTLNRRVSEIIGLRENHRIKEELKECVSFSYLIGVIFFFILHIILFLSYKLHIFSILQNIEDYCFYFIILCVFFFAFIIIPYRSLLESLSDFYFLAIARAVTSSSLFLIPFAYLHFRIISLKEIAITLLIFYVFLYFFYFFRAKKHQKKQEFIIYNPLNLELLRSVFNFEIGFLKETFWFSIFFFTSAIVLFFDRFYYPIFFKTEIIADQVTLLDLFNRVAIITGTISLVYFSAISVWYQEKNLLRIQKNLKAQLFIVSAIFTGILLVSYFFLEIILKWWLGFSYSVFMANNSYNLLLGVLLINFTILIVRPLQAIGKIKEVSIWLFRTTIIYIAIVVFLGVKGGINNHYIAYLIKGILDLFFLSRLLKKNKII